MSEINSALQILTEPLLSPPLCERGGNRLGSMKIENVYPEFDEGTKLY